MSDIIINKYHLYLESTQRTNGTNEDCNFFLSRPLFKSNPFNHFEVSVVQANIPYSFFQITNQNGNYSSLNWYLNRGGTFVLGSPANPRTITIPNGNYTILSLISAIQSAIISDLQSNYSSYANPNWNWTYNRDTLQVNFNLIGTDGIPTYFYIMPSNVTHGGLAYNMGVSSLLSFGYNASNLSQNATGQSAINVAPITSLLIRSGTLKQNRSFEFIAITDDVSDILVRVPCQTVGGTFIQYVNDAGISNRIKNEFIDVVNLYVTDNRNYTPISLAGLSWMCVLEIREIEGHENRENEAYNMLKTVNFGEPLEIEP
jgi:hypothetical protein